MSDAPHIAKIAPYKIDVQGERAYFQIAGAQSKTQPFCNCSNKGRCFQFMRFSVPKVKTAFLCDCKQSGDEPYCNCAQTPVTVP
jgi:CDGSH iron-sulfur domain-containing protein 3